MLYGASAYFWDFIAFVDGIFTSKYRFEIFTSDIKFIVKEISQFDKKRKRGSKLFFVR